MRSVAGAARPTSRDCPPDTPSGALRPRDESRRSRLRLSLHATEGNTLRAWGMSTENYLPCDSAGSMPSHESFIAYCMIELAVPIRMRPRVWSALASAHIRCPSRGASPASQPATHRACEPRSILRGLPTTGLTSEHACGGDPRAEMTGLRHRRATIRARGGYRASVAPPRASAHGQRSDRGNQLICLRIASAAAWANGYSGSIWSACSNSSSALPSMPLAQ